MTIPVATNPVTSTTARLARRLGDYAQLARPKIAAMVLVTALLGMYLADGMAQTRDVVLMLVGTALVSIGASTFNQFLERRTDARMKRTERRPLPAGRLTISEVVLFGLLTTIGGLVVLMMLSKGPAAAAVAATTFLLYIAVYTPLKRYSVWNTWIGAIPGAMPPLIGWAAGKGALTLESLPLFMILVLWQIPHFLAIAWMYRDEYRRAGMKMLPVFDATGAATAWHMIGHTLLLTAVSLLPLIWGAGWIYAVSALVLGGLYLAPSLKFRRDRSATTARSVLRWSLLYLPVVLLALFVDRL